MPVRARRSRLRSVGLGLLLLCVARAVSAQASPFDECDRKVRDAPEDLASFECYADVASAEGRSDEAVRRLEAYLQIQPERYFGWSVLGTLERRRGSPRAEELFRHAAALAEDHGDPTGVVKARGSLGTFLRREGRLDEAETEFELALRAALDRGEPRFIAYVRAKQAWLAQQREDYGRAKYLFRQAEAAAFPDGPLAMRLSVLGGLGRVCWILGQYAEAMRFHRRSVELAREAGDATREARSRVSLALVAESLTRSGRLEPQEMTRLADEALEATVALGDRGLEARVLLLMAEIHEGDRRRAAAERALALCEETGDWECRHAALRALGGWYLEAGPEHREEGLRLIDRAIEEARARGASHPLVRGLYLRAEGLHGAGGPREGWVAAYLEVLDEVETLRERQPEPRVRARVFSGYVRYYTVLARRLLESLDESATPAEDLDLAFRTLERMRTRLLLDSLGVAGVAGADESSPLSAERAEVLRDLARVQRELMRPDLSDDVRRERLARLEEFEATEAVLRDRLAREDPVYRALRPPAPASIADVQRLLGENQALLAFRVTAHGHPSTRREEGALYAWVFVITRRGADVFPVPPGWELDSQVQVYLGLLEGRDGKEASAADRLARDLLGRSLGSLPDDVRRLVIVPDRSLHRLPFGTLLSPEGEPLAERFEISYAPSATIWARWKKTPPESAGRATLAFADPEPPAPSGASRERAADPWLEGLRLGRLPFARREASNALRQLGRGELRTGPDASEHFLKHVDLERIGILHFAAHAVVDEERPDRSSVILAPGSVEEDGLLQVREIVELDLEGRLVLLTGCRSAQGEAIAGEGAMSLAHAFFQSGARSVVGSLWPLRDDETALLVSLFAERIARGASVAAALAGAQREMIEAGAPPAAWGGLVVLGDGDVVPVPGGRLRRLPVFAGLAFATAGGTLGLVLWLRRRSSREHRRASSVSRDA